MAEAQSRLRDYFPDYGSRGSLTDAPAETPRTALLEQYGSIVEPYEPSLSERIYNFAFDALGGNTATGLDRQRIQRRARYPQMAIDQTGLAALTDYSQAMQDYARGDALSGTTNMAMAAASLIPGPQKQAVEEIANRLSKGTFGKTLKADDVFSLTDRNAAGMTPNMVDYQTAGILDRNPNYFRESKDVDYEIMRMSPDEYLERGAAILRPEGKTTQYVIDDRAKESGYIDNMAASMQGGQVYAAPYLDYGSGGRDASQEGMHRALAAKQLGMEEIPVMVLDSYKNPKSPYRSALNEMDTPAQGQSALNNLDMSYDARMRRADEMGMTTQGYSGSTHDISSFRGDISNPQNDWGRGTYASTSIDDVNANYAGVGPDLTGRIQTESERVADALSDYPDELLSEYGFTLEDYNRDEAGVAEAISKKMLVGDAEGGIVYPLRINTEKYAVIGGPDSTTLEFDKSAIKGLDPDSDEYYEALNEASGDLYQKVYDAISDTDAYQSTDQIEMVMSDVSEYLADGQLDLDDLDSSIRRHITDAYDDATGDILSPGGISAQVLENLGYEGVIDNTVNEKFGTRFPNPYNRMEGVYPDTQHIITFPGKESRIRSTYAAFDPSKKGSSNILAGIAGAGVVGGSALSGQKQEQKQ